MELTSKRKTKAAVPAAPQPAWAIAVRKKFGNLQSFIVKFSPNVQRYCAQNMFKAVADNIPTFGQIVGTYGEKGVSRLIATHITDAILRMGEEADVDHYDVQFISEAICESVRFRLLKVSTVFGFFHLLKGGEFDIYGKVTPRKIMEVFRSYAVNARAKEIHIAEELESRRKAAEREDATRNAVTWEEYARIHNLSDGSFLAYYLRLQKENTERREAWRTFGDAMTSIYKAVGTVVEWRENGGEDIEIPAEPQENVSMPLGRRISMMAAPKAAPGCVA